MARVALVLPSLAVGGAERLLVTVGEALAARGHAVQGAVTQGGGPLRPTWPVRDLGVSRVAWSVAPLARWLSHIRPEVTISALTHMNLATLTAWGAAGRPGRVVVTEHAAADAGGAWVQAMRGAARLAYGRADRLAVMDPSLARAAPRVFGREAVVLPLVVDEARLQAEARAPFPSPWGPDDTRPRVVSLGRLVPGKRVDRIVAAVAHRSWPADHTLVVVGDGPERAALDAQVARLGLADRVSCVGHASAPGRWLAGAAALGIASAQETGPLVALEAAVLGVPVVTTPCSARLAHPAPGRIVVDEPTPAALAAAVARVGEAGRPVPPWPLAEAIDRWTAALGISAFEAG